MLTDVPGVKVGHWTEPAARTGCTVIVLPPSTVASGEVRGGAPASREFSLLDPTKTVRNVDAVVLSGGSAFGLAAADGVVDWLAERDRGFETSAARVPIVVGLSLFDLAVGDAQVRPGPTEGRAAADAAAEGPFETGQVGAGTGATVAKWLGREATRPGGIVTSTVRSGPIIVSSLVAVNAVGAVDDGTTLTDPGPPVRPEDADGTNTTIGVVVTNAIVDKVGCRLLAESAHDGLARSLFPAHTAADGDAFVVGATGEVEADLMYLRVLAQLSVTRAVRSLAP